MAKIIMQTSTWHGAITNDQKLYDAFTEAKQLAARLGLTISDMPTLVQAFANPSFREIARNTGITTLTSEHFGMRNGKLVYEVWHSVGSLSDIPFLYKAQGDDAISKDGFIEIPIEEWEQIGGESLNGEYIPRIDVGTLRIGVKIPSARAPFVVYKNIDGGKLEEEGRNIPPSEFVLNDRMLMLFGSLENLARMAGLLFTGNNIGENKNGFYLSGINPRESYSMARGRLTRMLPSGIETISNPADIRTRFAVLSNQRDQSYTIDGMVED